MAVVRGVIRVYDDHPLVKIASRHGETNERIVLPKCGTWRPKKDEGSIMRSNQNWCGFKVIIRSIINFKGITNDEWKQGWTETT
jgi:hypothetical protein